MHILNTSAPIIQYWVRELCDRFAEGKRAGIQIIGTVLEAEFMAVETDRRCRILIP